MIIEILSPSNAGYDREKKFKVYQEAGVPEYWLVDYQAKTIEVFRLISGVYNLQGKYGIGDTLISTQLPGFNLPVQSIFNL